MSEGTVPSFYELTLAENVYLIQNMRLSWEDVRLFETLVSTR